MYSFPDLEPVHCSMSGSNCCFLICMQISHEAGKVVWFSHLFKSFPQFVVIYLAKDFSIVNETEIDVIFLEFSCFVFDPMDVTNLISSPLPFLNWAWRSGSSWFTYCGSYLDNFQHYFARVWNVCICVVFGHSLTFPFFGVGMKIDLFQSCGHYCFPNLLTYWVQHFHSIIFQDLK